jgi:multidrug efflux pump subunit AcrA (membrane-fusion protein)
MLLPATSCFSDKSVNKSEVLLKKPDSSASDMNANVAEVTLGSISRNTSGEGSIVFPIAQKIACNLTNARLNAINVKRGDSVKAGDVIAEFTIEYNQSDLDSLKSDLSIAEKQYEISLSSYQSAVTASQDRITSLNAQKKTAPYEGLDNDIAKAGIALKKAKSALNFFKYDQQRSLNTLRGSIEKFESNINTNKIYSPFDGIIGSAEYLPVGNILAPGTEICTIYSKDVMWISSSSDTSNGMRYNSSAEIKVSVVNDTYSGRIITAPDLFGQSTGKVIVIPDTAIDIDPGDRMRRLTVSAPRFELDGVMILPSAAVYNEDGKRFVYLYEDGIMKKRYVTVGMSSVDSVQILDGLTVGQKVVLD